MLLCVHVCVQVVLDEACEYYTKSKQRRALGRILLKGETITLMTALSSSDFPAESQ